MSSNEKGALKQPEITPENTNNKRVILSRRFSSLWHDWWRQQFFTWRQHEISCRCIYETYLLWTATYPDLPCSRMPALSCLEWLRFARTWFHVVVCVGDWAVCSRTIQIFTGLTLNASCVTSGVEDVGLAGIIVKARETTVSPWNSVEFSCPSNFPFYSFVVIVSFRSTWGLQLVCDGLLVSNQLVIRPSAA